MVFEKLKKILGKGDEGLAFPQDLILGHSAGEATNPNNSIEETQIVSERISYLTRDGPVMNLVALNPEIHDWLMYITPLNSTGKLDKRLAALQMQRIENAAIRSKLLMPAEKYEANGYEYVEGLRNFAEMRTFEAIEGWKGHLCTENVRRIEAGVKKQ